MKKYRVVGKHFTPRHGYLCSHGEEVIEAKNKKEAINKARETWGGSLNRFFATEVKNDSCSDFKS